MSPDPTTSDPRPSILEISHTFAAKRAERQLRRHLDPGDFRALADAGYLKLAVPSEMNGLWRGVRGSTRVICDALRSLAQGDSSVALVSAMHPAVLSFWLAAPETLDDEAWKTQKDRVFNDVLRGAWWGTITSEPGSGGDINRTRTQAQRGDGRLGYFISGKKHFGSGSGIASFMITTAVPEGETEPDWFYMDMRGLPPEGDARVKLIAPWDGHGMIATQSHAFAFDRFPATRIAWQGHLQETTVRCGAFINCLFASVIVGIVEVAMRTASAKLDLEGAYAQVEWARARMEAWLIAQAHEGMLRAVEQESDPRMSVLQGKTAIAELSETILTRLCRIIGGGTFARHSPFGHWFEDVRALGFLRPPWPLAFELMAKTPV